MNTSQLIDDILFQISHTNYEMLHWCIPNFGNVDSMNEAIVWLFEGIFKGIIPEIQGFKVGIQDLSVTKNIDRTNRKILILILLKPICYKIIDNSNNDDKLDWPLRCCGSGNMYQ